LIVNVVRDIFVRMMGAEPMLKHAQRNVPTAKPRRKPIDIEKGYNRVMERFPRIMARLGA
jgi:hypothetical protein